MNEDNLSGWAALAIYTVVGVWGGRKLSETWARRLLRLNLFLLIPFLLLVLFLWRCIVRHFDIGPLAVPILFATVSVFLISFFLSFGLVSCPAKRRVGLFVLSAAAPPLIALICIVRFIPMFE